jgi:PKHD-type hydroxylase
VSDLGPDPGADFRWVGPPSVPTAFEPRSTEALSADDARRLAELLRFRPWSPLVQSVGGRAHRQVEIQELPAGEFSALTGHLREVLLSANDLSYRFHVTGSRRSDAPHAVRYLPGHGHYDWHVDAGSEWPTRKLSLVLFLSGPEDYLGGDLVISGVEDPLRPAPGTAVVFPSFVAHRVSTVTAGERLVIVCWMHGPTFR